MSEIAPLVELAGRARQAAEWADFVQADLDADRPLKHRSTLLAELAKLKESISRVEDMLG